MHQLTGKIKLIFIPFLIIAVSVISGYTFLNWLLFIKLQTFSIREDFRILLIPMALPWIPALIWLRPRIKLLNLKRKNGDLAAFFLLIACFAIIAPTINAQFYIETASGKLTKLNHITDISKTEATKYYTLENFYIDKQRASAGSHFGTSGKRNQYLDMSIYFVVPILDSASNAPIMRCNAWYGIKYTKQISNKLEQNEKEKLYQEFSKASLEDFEARNVNEFVYFDRVGNTVDLTYYLAAIRKNGYFYERAPTVFIPVNAAFEKRNGNKFVWIFGSFLIGAAVWLIMITAAKFKTPEPEQPEDLPVSKTSFSVKKIFESFIPREGFYITPVIIGLNILGFLSMVLAGLGFWSFDAADLVYCGGNYRPFTANGEWWRLLSNIFLHGGFIHLAANIYGLLLIGVILEPVLKKMQYAIIYLVTGILASVTSFLWHTNTVSVGASGAIFGLYGVFLAFLLTKVFTKDFSKAFLTNTLVFIGINLLMGLSGGIDNAAHIGGLVSGFVIGLAYSGNMRRNRELKEMEETYQTEETYGERSFNE